MAMFARGCAYHNLRQPQSMDQLLETVASAHVGQKLTPGYTIPGYTCISAVWDAILALSNAKQWLHTVPNTPSL